MQIFPVYDSLNHNLNLIPLKHRARVKVSFNSATMFVFNQVFCSFFQFNYTYFYAYRASVC